MERATHFRKRPRTQVSKHLARQDFYDQLEPLLSRWWMEVSDIVGTREVVESNETVQPDI